MKTVWGQYAPQHDIEKAAQLLSLEIAMKEWRAGWTGTPLATRGIFFTYTLDKSPLDAPPKLPSMLDGVWTPQELMGAAALLMTAARTLIPKRHHRAMMCLFERLMDRNRFTAVD